MFTWPGEKSIVCILSVLVLISPDRGGYIFFFTNRYDIVTTTRAPVTNSQNNITTTLGTYHVH